MSKLTTLLVTGKGSIIGMVLSVLQRNYPNATLRRYKHWWHLVSRYELRLNNLTQDQRMLVRMYLADYPVKIEFY